ncbi:hypothetical protein Tco_0824995 [Tanacetum coccineum]
MAMFHGHRNYEIALYTSTAKANALAAKEIYREPGFDFMTRSRSWSFIERPDLLLLAAFLAAQLEALPTEEMNLAEVHCGCIMFGEESSRGAL